jgi:hypothetical protein
VQALDEVVDLFGDRVEVEARAVRGGKSLDQLQPSFAVLMLKLEEVVAVDQGAHIECAQRAQPRIIGWQESFELERK